MKDKLLILGMGEKWRNTPIHRLTRQDFDVWGMSTAYKNESMFEIYEEDFTLWWEIHTLDTRSEEHLEWLKNCKIPLMMQEKFDEIPMSIKYPLDEILEKYNRRYFTCTMNYQIAYAMLVGYKEIHLYGVNMILGDDYVQRYSLEYWLGRAEQSGIKLVISEYSDLLKAPYLYGYEINNSLGVYIEKYISSKQYAIRGNLMKADMAISKVMEDYAILVGERDKFMKEIFARQGTHPQKYTAYEIEELEF